MSDVFYSFIVENRFWDLRIRQRSKEEYFSVAEEFAEKLMVGKFSREMEEQFVKLLEYYGQDPIIVRSSSILEDGFGNAFAGKYESVFCSNSGDMDQRLEDLDPTAGMLRLVMGLGTSAVDRTEGSYPRLVSLDKPKAVTARDSVEKHQYSQRKLELMNRAARKLEQVDHDGCAKKYGLKIIQIIHRII